MIVVLKVEELGAFVGANEIAKGSLVAVAAMVVFRTSQVLDEDAFLFLTRAKLPADGQCIGAFTHRLALVIHIDDPAPNQSVDNEEVVPFTPADGRYGLLPEQPTVSCIIRGDKIPALHNDRIVYREHRSR